MNMLPQSHSKLSRSSTDNVEFKGTDSGNISGSPSAFSNRGHLRSSSAENVPFHEYLTPMNTSNTGRNLTRPQNISQQQQAAGTSRRKKTQRRHPSTQTDNEIHQKFTKLKIEGHIDRLPEQKVQQQPTKYIAERVIGNGSFGVVYQARIADTDTVVAIKKVLQDKRYKNRELSIMQMLKSCNIVELKQCFFSRDKPKEVYLNLVMEYIPSTLSHFARHCIKEKRSVPIILAKVYTYQLARALAYCHANGLCHRDIKPQNLLLDPETNIVKLCDFGSAKLLTKGEPNVSYICSRYYRAPELIFCATFYTSAIDVWSMGCVLAELLLGQPLFPGESGIDQLVEIIKVLGTPTLEEIHAMNPNYAEFTFPNINPHPWRKVFRNRVPANAIDLVSKLLRYKPNSRLTPLQTMAHPFFDELRDPGTTFDSKPLPPLFNFSEQELKLAESENVLDKLVPHHLRHNYPTFFSPRYSHINDLRPEKSPSSSQISTISPKHIPKKSPTIGSSPSRPDSKSHSTSFPSIHTRKI